LRLRRAGFNLWLKSQFETAVTARAGVSSGLAFMAAALRSFVERELKSR
jgi:hypothetical protein